MKSFFTRFLSLALFAFVLISADMSAQVTSSGIFGKVTDDGGNALPSVAVVATHVPTGTVYGTTSRNDGNFNTFGLRPGGPYTITATMVGKKKVVLENISLDLGQNLRLDFVLYDEAVQLQEVMVTAEKNPILSETRTGAAQTIDKEQIQLIPTISRRFQDLSKLTPQFSGNGSDLNAAGRSSRYNNIQIDGTQYNDLFGLGSSGTPGGQAKTTPISLDAIDEFQVVVAPFDVRLSGFTGGGINAVTKSGTNTYTVAAYGYGRNQSFVGKSPDANKTAFADFSEYTYGISAGGPIQKDKLFFFANVERTDYTRPLNNVSLTQGSNTALYKAYADSVATILAAKGMSAGSYGEYKAKRPSTKVFARLDWNLNNTNKFTLRHNFVDASDDILSKRDRNTNISFDSYTYQFNSTTNSTVLQWNSSWGNNISNEFVVGYTRIRDNRKGKSEDRPEVEVRNGGITITAGPDRFSSANRLDQDIWEVSNNFTYITGKHVLTFGTHNEFFSFTNLFIRSFFGYYVFSSIQDLAANKVNSYQRSFGRAKDSFDYAPAAEFDVRQYGFYVQDEWSVSDKVKLTLGLRVDIPTIPQTPARNDSVSKYFAGYSTEGIPSGNLLWSPRLGFNYKIDDERKSQIRGGVGIFTGRIPYVWMSNNFGNSGVLLAEISGGNGTVFSIDPRVQPRVGDPGTGAPNLRSEINMADPNLKLPQIFRVNVGYDQTLPFGFIGTVEFLYAKSLNEMFYEKLNISKIDAPTTLTSEAGRLIYGGTDRKNNNFNDVLSLKNTSEGYQYNLSVQLQRNVARGLSVNMGYTYGKAEDVNSLTSSQAQSQMRYNPISENPNNPPLRTSLYEIKHRIFAALTFTHEFLKGAPTAITVYYNGQSGQPFSFIVRGDVNNDGFDRNDLVYIPKDDNDIKLGSYNATTDVFTPNQTMYDNFNAFIENNDYLRENRGKMSERNGARNPWRDIIDLKIVQDIPSLGNHRFQVSLDILNVLNLINSDWGYDQYVFSTYETLGLVNTMKDGSKVYSFTAPANNVPWTNDDITSRWAMQLGIRYFFN